MSPRVCATQNTLCPQKTHYVDEMGQLGIAVELFRHVMKIVCLILLQSADTIDIESIASTSVEKPADIHTEECGADLQRIFVLDLWV